MAKLHFYYSAMNAGKSTTLLQSSYNYQERGMDTLLFTPAFDTRYGVGKVYSRIGIEAGAIPFTADFDLFAYTKEALRKNSKIRCVLIDEAQFLSKNHVMQLTEIVDNFNLPVLAYGLRTDYMGELFEGSQYLLGLAEEISEIKTICHCGRKATMNMRIDAERRAIKSGNQVVIGGNESYISTCRKHFKLGDAGVKKNIVELAESE